MGATINILTGYLISRVSARNMVVISAILTAVAPMLMATLDLESSYWYAAFWAMLLSPINPDGKSASIMHVTTHQHVTDEMIVLFTISNLIISDAYPPEVQSLAGGVFNEVSQFGNSVGLAVTAAIAASVTEHSDIADHKTAMMTGYRAAFWTIFAATSLVIILAFFGLKKGELVGRKEE